MQGDRTVIQHLNGVLKNELTAINQYFLHARMLRHWGVTKLGDHEYKESVDEMKHADRLIDRILYLNKLLIGETVAELLDCDLKLEQAAMPLLRDAIAYCETVKDYVSRELFEGILQGEEEHVDFLETQIGLIDRVGIENYIQLQSGHAE
jgi:bacterioferritin